MSQSPSPEDILCILKSEERDALIRCFTYPIGHLCGEVFFVVIILKLFRAIGWSWWYVTAPIWAGFLVNLCIYFAINLIYRLRK